MRIAYCVFLSTQRSSRFTFHVSLIGRTGLQIIVTGGAGFIGSHLCTALLADGHTVLVLDNFVTGNSRNIAHLGEHPRFRLIEHDIAHPLPADLPAADAIFHLASPASPADFSRIPLAI